MTQLEDPHRALLHRVLSGALAFLAVAAVGSGGYWLIGQGRWSYADCLYMTMITLSTVGFGETLAGMDAMPVARVWTILQIVLGSGALIYFISSFTALVVDGDLRGAFRRTRMNHAIAALSGHVVVCGSGDTGQHVVAELVTSRAPFVIVERNAAVIQRLSRELGTELLHIVGDATDDEVLLRAGVARAKGLIAVLTDDRDNLMVTITARALSDRVRIVAKAVLTESRSKLLRAGATSVVSPQRIGGIRMVSEIVRPTVVEFLDEVLQDREEGRRIEEIAVTPGGRLAGRRFREIDPADAMGAHIIGVKQVDGAWLFNPSPDRPLNAGETLLAVVPTAKVPALRTLVG